MTTTQADYDSFGWNPIRGLDPSESYGLDYESAFDATPHWYGVSFGNGNDGVSQLFPDYYVRTCDPWRLAGLAMLANFNNANPEDKRQIIDATEIDGEAAYTISACIYNPEDIDPPQDQEEMDLESDDGTWCDSNGAWVICEVFPVDPMPCAFLIDDRGVPCNVEYNPYGKPAYTALESCFDQSDLDLIE